MSMIDEFDPHSAPLFTPKQIYGECEPIARVPYLAGRNWTTDAIYRETVDRIARHRADGCISVEMEAAGLEAVADAVGAELYTFFFGGDILGERWEIGNIGGEREKKQQESLFDLALDFAKTLS